MSLAARRIQLQVQVSKLEAPRLPLEPAGDLGLVIADAFALAFPKSAAAMICVLVQTMWRAAEGCGAVAAAEL
jgi:hypothetical protein